MSESGDEIDQARRGCKQLRRSDLSGAFLQGVDLAGVDLRESNLENSDLTMANLDDADLTGARLGAAILSRASARRASFRRADLSGGRLDGADLTGADMTDARAVASDFSFAFLAGATMDGADFTNSTLRSADLRDAFIRRARFRAANLESANLTRASLDEADLTSAVLDEADFTRASLAGGLLADTSFRRTILRSADITSARVTFARGLDADLRSCRAQQADFSHTNLNGANFRFADLRHANLSGASTEGVDFSDAALGGASVSSLHAILESESPVCSNLRFTWHAIARDLNHPGLQQLLLASGMPNVLATYTIESLRSLDEADLFSMLLSVFISYGGPDSAFALKLNDRLGRNGVKTFFYPRSSVPGRSIAGQMARAASVFDKTVVICSRTSLVRPGVQAEIVNALEREARLGFHEILIAIRWDDPEDLLSTGDWATGEYRWIQRKLKSRTEADFRNCEDEPSFQRELGRLLRALRRSQERPSGLPG